MLFHYHSLVDMSQITLLITPFLPSHVTNFLRFVLDHENYPFLLPLGHRRGPPSLQRPTLDLQSGVQPAAGIPAAAGGAAVRAARPAAQQAGPRDERVHEPVDRAGQPHHGAGGIPAGAGQRP